MFKHCFSTKFLNTSGPYSFIYGLVLIGALLLLYGFMYVVDDMLPPALLIAQEKNDTERFIAERAKNDLKELVSIGPRVTGTYENEVLAVSFLKQKISEIQADAHRNHVIESDLQIVSNYLFNDKKRIYENVQNVVVKLHAANYTHYSILVNVHFDSVENSPGGSDNGINCAVALEVLRKLTKNSIRFKHNIIFLFNGAEEPGLLGSEGFMTQHKWAEEVKIVVNLDSAGSGGKALLFQTGPKQPWLLKYYSKVRQPFALVIAEEIYQQKFLPFRTDYSTFIRFRNITGFDFAFMKNPYKYHTKFDDFESIPLGSYQHIGDITLDLVRNLANASEVSDYNQPVENCVFFDLWGVYFVYYTETNATIINVVTGIFSIAVTILSFYHFELEFSKKTIKYFAIAVVCVFSGWVVSLIYVLIIGSILNEIGFDRSWNNNMWIIVGLYILPTVAIACGVTCLFGYCKMKEITIRRHAEILVHLQRLIWTICLFIGTGLKVRSIFLMEISIFCQTACFIMVHIAFLYRSEKVWLFIYFLTTLISSSLLMKYSYLLGFVFSVLSRSGSSIEIYVTLVTWGFTIMITSTYIPLIHLIKKAFIPIAILLGIHLVFLVMVFTPLGYPYSSDSKSAVQAPFIFNLVVKKQHGINNDSLNKNTSLEIVRKYRNKWTFENVVGLHLANLTDLVSTDVFHMTVSKEQLESQINYNFTFNLPNNAFINFDTKKSAYIKRIKLQKIHSIECNETFYSIKYVRGLESILNLCLTVIVPQGRNRSMLELETNTYYKYNINQITFPYYTKYFNHYIHLVDSLSVHINEKWTFENLNVIT